MDRPRHPWWALALLVPAPSVGAAAAMWWWPDSVTGQTFFTLSKIWLFALPFVWHRWVDGGRWSWSPARRSSRSDWGMAVVSGLLAGAAVVAAYVFVAPHLVDLDAAAREIRAIGLDRPALVLAMATYWILVNSVLEEMVWRWFVVRQGEAALASTASTSGAVWLSAAAFTVHHAVALAVYLPPTATALASLGVGLGGAFWGWLYVRSGSVWPPWVSHAIVDVAVFGSAYHLLFLR